MRFLRFRRSFRIGPGLRVNIGKRGASLSAGVRGAHVTIGKDGVRTTVGLPGTGLSYTEHSGRPRTDAVEGAGEAPATPGSATRGWLWIALLVAVVVGVIVAAAG